MFGFGSGTTPGTGLQAPVNWQQTSLPMNMIGGYIPPGAADYSLFGSTGAPGVSTGLTLGSGGVGMQAPNTGFWAPGNNSVMGGKLGSDSGLGFNLGTLNMGVNALAAIGGLYSAFQSNKLAKDQFNFTKEVTNTNLNNQIKTFNTTMEDRARARARLDGHADPEAYTKDYMDKNRISRG